MFTLDDILQGNPDLLQGNQGANLDRQRIFQSAQHDSRQVGAGDLYVAIKGTTVDGHRFIASAVQAGASGILCTTGAEDLPAEVIQLIVPDVIKALQGAARVRARRQQGTTYIGITGSNGKTSTKDAVASVLSYKGTTLKTLKSYNNELGYPLTLLRLEPGQRYAVLEMGAQRVGELAGLCRDIASPDWSIITNVGTAHLEYFGSQENIAIAKSELVQVLKPEGFAILNYDDANVRAMAAKTRARVLYYGTAKGADVRASEIAGSPLLGYHCKLQYQREQRPIQLHLPGEHSVIIALAAAAAGIAAEMSIDEIADALTRLTASPGRGQIKSGPNGSTLIDDTYNANRQSIVAITNAMRATELAARGKRWAVLGDIFELGPYAREEHLLSGAALAGNIERLVAIGDEARFYVEGAIAAGMPADHTYYFSANVRDSQEVTAVKRAVADLLKHEVGRNDLVLVKGSRGMMMETLLTLL
ncbi:MAG TPA: UDP-N-acetylmuramoyl-tripeptide--D-alanyl-D-alanine ligase [Ktedonobacteraceae bacterium]|jgi:UDP-N-acetylmuramoyl-tripeptide--D-alanyl-D-alanine ligase|nr:UDP-N-acetylmuramoyl-tripeptide--D-alanyl-D-alanine ligase [Ktedonobacteraceae bacterium]